MTGTTSVPGKVGVARDFSGTSADLVSVADHSTLDITSAITVTAWVKREGTNGGGWGGIWFDQATSWRSRLLVHDDGTVLAQFRIGSVDESFGTAAGLVPQGVWTHVAFIYDGTTQRIYVNGVERASDPASGTITTSASARLLGRGFNVAGQETYFFNGVIDELRVFNRDLTGSEATSLYDGTFRLLSPGLSLYDDSANILTVYEPTSKPRNLHLDMETLLNGKLEDFAGHGSHGTMSGTIAAPGPIGGARDFDGTDDFVETADAPWLDATTALTVSMWINHDYNSNPSNIKGLFFKGADTGGGRNYNAHLTTSRKLEMQWGDGSSVYTLTGATALTDRTRWYHVAFVFDWVRDTFKIYVDGVQDGSLASTGGVVTNAGKLVIGKVSEASATGRFFDGVIDEVQLIDRAAAGIFHEMGIPHPVHKLLPGQSTPLAASMERCSFRSTRYPFERDRHLAGSRCAYVWSARWWNANLGYQPIHLCAGPMDIDRPILLCMGVSWCKIIWLA